MTMTTFSPLPHFVGLTPDPSAENSYHSTPSMSSNYYNSEPAVSMAGDEERHMYTAGTYYPFNHASNHQSSQAYSSQEQYPPYNPWLNLPSYNQLPNLNFNNGGQQQIYPQLDTLGINQESRTLPVFGRNQSYQSDTSLSYLRQPVQDLQHTDPRHPNHRQSHADNRMSLSHSSVSSSVSPSLSAAGTHSTNDTAISSTFASTATDASSSLFTFSHSTSNPSSSKASSASASNNSLAPYGHPLTPTGPWRCAYPGCTSRALFTRGCDLRKHYNRHSKHLFCRVEGCPQSESYAATIAANNSNPKPLSSHSSGNGHSSSSMISTSSSSNTINKPTNTVGFSSKKDRARHEAKHNPSVRCEWSAETDESGNLRDADGNVIAEAGSALAQNASRKEVCGRVFSRVDNMKDHVRRVHRKGMPETGSLAEGGGGGSQKVPATMRRKI